jgi:hypothetical protein
MGRRTYRYRAIIMYCFLHSLFHHFQFISETRGERTRISEILLGWRTYRTIIARFLSSPTNFGISGWKKDTRKRGAGWLRSGADDWAYANHQGRAARRFIHSSFHLCFLSFHQSSLLLVNRVRYIEPAAWRLFRDSWWHRHPNAGRGRRRGNAASYLPLRRGIPRLIFWPPKKSMVPSVNIERDSLIIWKRSRSLQV